MTLPAAVIFDWDNTLIDTFPLLKEANNLVRRMLGYPEWDDAEARSHIRLTAKDSYPALYGDRWREAERLFYDHVAAHHLQSLKVMSGAEDLLRILSSAGVPLGVLSNKRGDILRREVSHLGWQVYFGVVYGPDDVGNIGKPKPDGLYAVMRVLGVEKVQGGDCWYVGDTENDMATARAAGVVPVFIENHSMSKKEDIAAQKPAFAFTSCLECAEYLGLLIKSVHKNQTL